MEKSAEGAAYSRCDSDRWEPKLVRVPSSPQIDPAYAPSRKYVDQLERLLVREADNPGKFNDELLSIFVIGSCSGDIHPTDWYQDFDVHFRFAPIVLGRSTLSWLGNTLSLCEAIQDSNCKIQAFTRDRHWKMPPDRRWPANEGIHATLLGAADHVRRVHYNPILSQNMYVRCKVLWGAHPRELVGFRPSVAADYAHSVGGVAWLVENFTRMVGLHVLDPTDRTFFPFISGYCWNAASTLMFHLATLEHPGIYSREGAFHRFRRRARLPRDVSDAADRLYESREMLDAELGDHIEHINAAARLVTYIAGEALTLTGLDKGDTTHAIAIPAHPRVLYSKDVANALGLEDPITFVEAIVPRLDGRDFYAVVAETVGSAAKAAGMAVCVKENFEFLRQIYQGSRNLTRLRLWTTESLGRRRLSFDFAHDQGLQSMCFTLFNWEDGTQALLQRLNELFVEKRTVDEEVAALSSAVAIIVKERCGVAGINIPAALSLTSGSSDFDSITRALGKILSPHIISHRRLTIQ